MRGEYLSIAGDDQSERMKVYLFLSPSNDNKNLLILTYQKCLYILICVVPLLVLATYTQTINTFIHTKTGK